MNQILFNKKENKKIKTFFKLQFIISIIIALVLLINIYINKFNDKKLESLSSVIDKNVELTSIYEVEKTNTDSLFLGKIIIEKIDLEYGILNYINNETLKISPCRFFGPDIGNKGNICIAGHNYNDDRFFGRLDELEINDKITLVSIDGEKFEYFVFKIFETTEDDMSILKATKNYELTLLTCNNSNKKRIIIKAYKKEY